eukprot:scaffold6246_cov98-Isochrysis_galbana.AAC.2
MGEEWERGGGVSGRQGTEVSHRVAARCRRVWSAVHEEAKRATPSTPPDSGECRRFRFPARAGRPAHALDTHTGQSRSTNSAGFSTPQAAIRSVRPR